MNSEQFDQNKIGVGQKAGIAGNSDAEHLHQTRAKLETMVRLLDQSIPIPGTGMTIGLDPIIGLIPGIGDAIGVAMSGYVIYLSAKVGAPARLMVKMAGNVVLDAVVGLVPVFGDIFDFAFKSNTRNAKLLHSHLEARLQVIPDKRSKRIKMLLAGGLIAGLSALLILAMIGIVSLFRG